MCLELGAGLGGAGLGGTGLGGAGLGGAGLVSLATAVVLKCSFVVKT